MKAIKNGKIVIIGAGHVGSHCGLSLMMQGLADEIVYIDIDKNKAVMQALDLDDMASNLDRDFTVRAGDYSDCADAHIVVMAAGKSRLPGQTRLDMFDDSIKMMNTIVGPLKESGFHGILISISNPADIIADFLRKRLGLPRSQVFSTGTSLDSARLRRMLSEITGVSRHSIQAYCMGEHGDSQFIPVSHIQIGGIPVKEYLSIHPEYRDKMDFDNIARAVMHDEKRILPVSVLLEGEYGEQGVPAGVPCVIGKNGVEEILEISLTEKEKEQLHNSCNVIRGFVEKADQM